MIGTNVIVRGATQIR